MHGVSTKENDIQYSERQKLIATQLANKKIPFNSIYVNQKTFNSMNVLEISVITKEILSIIHFSNLSNIILDTICDANVHVYHYSISFVEQSMPNGYRYIISITI